MEANQPSPQTVATKAADPFSDPEKCGFIVTIIVLVFVTVILAAYFVMEQKTSEMHTQLGKYNLETLQNFTTANRAMAAPAPAAMMGFGGQAPAPELQEFPDLIKNEPVQEKKRRGPKKVAALATSPLRLNDFNDHAR